MATRQRLRAKVDKEELHAFHIRLPGFMIKEPVGLGDAIKRATYAMGFKPCGGCEKRAASLNRSVVFTR